MRPQIVGYSDDRSSLRSWRVDVASGRKPQLGWPGEGLTALHRQALPALQGGRIRLHSEIRRGPEVAG
jgi:hypothetical protein